MTMVYGSHDAFSSQGFRYSVQKGQGMPAETNTSKEPLGAVLELMTEQLHQVEAGASISLRHDNHNLETIASTASHIASLDGVQYEFHRGPCIEATLSDMLIESPITLSQERWPEFSEVTYRLGFRSILSLPLHANQDSIGSLNLYLKQNGYPSKVVRDAEYFASQLSILVSNTLDLDVERRTNQQLQLALESREMIGQAKGILMARGRYTRDEAFNVLRRRSQLVNKKLRDVAQDIVLTEEAGSS